MTPRLVRGVTAVIFIGGIAGMIVGSIADNNGTAMTFGLITAVAALCLLLSTAMTLGAPVMRFDEDTAEAMERRIESLVREGADEAELRALVREAVTLGRDAAEERVR